MTSLFISNGFKSIKMKIFFLISIYILGFITDNFSQETNKSLDSLLYKEVFKNGNLKFDNIDFKLIDSLEQSFSKAERMEVYSKLVKIAYSQKQYDSTFEFLKRRVLSGETNFNILEDSIGVYYARNYPNLYSKLERIVDSVAIQKSTLFSQTINLELMFTLRRMLRIDQRYKIQFNVALTNGESVEYLDSLMLIARKNDEANEVILAQIFDEYGYPGYNIVGYDASIAAILFLHMSSEFMIKYIYLIDRAIKEGQLHYNIEFVIDKTLYLCCRKSIYGNWGNVTTLVTDSVERDSLLIMLKLSK